MAWLGQIDEGEKTPIGGTVTPNPVNFSDLWSDRKRKEEEEEEGGWTTPEAEPAPTYYQPEPEEPLAPAPEEGPAPKPKKQEEQVEVTPAVVQQTVAQPEEEEKPEEVVLNPVQPPQEPVDKSFQKNAEKSSDLDETWNKKMKAQYERMNNAEPPNPTQPAQTTTPPPAGNMTAPDHFTQDAADLEAQWFPQTPASTQTQYSEEEINDAIQFMRRDLGIMEYDPQVERSEAIRYLNEGVVPVTEHEPISDWLNPIGEKVSDSISNFGNTDTGQQIIEDAQRRAALRDANVPGALEGGIPGNLGNIATTAMPAVTQAEADIKNFFSPQESYSDQDKQNMADEMKLMAIAGGADGRDPNLDSTISEIIEGQTKAESKNFRPNSLTGQQIAEARYQNWLKEKERDSIISIGPGNSTPDNPLTPEGIQSALDENYEPGTVAFLDKAQKDSLYKSTPGFEEISAWDQRKADFLAKADRIKRDLDIASKEDADRVNSLAYATKLDEALKEARSSDKVRHDLAIQQILAEVNASERRDRDAIREYNIEAALENPLEPKTINDFFEEGSTGNPIYADENGKHQSLLSEGLSAPAKEYYNLIPDTFTESQRVEFANYIESRVARLVAQGFSNDAIEMEVNNLLKHPEKFFDNYDRYASGITPESIAVPTFDPETGNMNDILMDILNDGNQPIVEYVTEKDENGKTKYDANGNPIYVLDDSGNPMTQIVVDKDGNPITKQKYTVPTILNLFANTGGEWEGEADIPEGDGAGFRGIVIPDEVRKLLASSHLRAQNQGDNAETIRMTEAEYKRLADAFMAANPVLQMLVSYGKIALSDIEKFFFKNIEFIKGRSGYGGGGYMPRYGGGGRGGYGGGGYSGGGSSKSPTNQKQSRIYNIMKNWSF